MKTITVIECSEIISNNEMTRDALKEFLSADVDFENKEA